MHASHRAILDDTRRDLDQTNPVIDPAKKSQIIYDEAKNLNTYLSTPTLQEINSYLLEWGLPVLY